jgi:phosphoglucomutase
MTISPLAGKLLPPSALVDVPRLVTAYFTQTPDPANPVQRVAFGTSGHRGSSFDGTFNETHILAISQAVCQRRRAAGVDGPLFIGIDTHALSRPALATALEVFAANGVDAFIDEHDGYTPTPVISHAILTYNRGRTTGLADGVVVTPSHNPPEDGGFKYNTPDGGPADIDVTSEIERVANALLTAGRDGVKRVPLGRALKSAHVHRHDFIGPYVEDLEHVVDMDIIRSSGVRIGIDPLGGAAVGFWQPIIERYGIAATVVSDAVDPTFRFMTADWDGRIRMDCSSPYAMTRLVAMRGKFDVAFANDTDADRHGIVAGADGLMNPNHVLAVAIDYLYANRPAWGPTAAVGKTLVSSGVIDRVAGRLGRAVVEVPVGFKWFTKGLLAGKLGFAGEESGGASFLRRDGTAWTTDKDGLIVGLLAAEITARTGTNPAVAYDRIAHDLGRSWYERTDAPATTAERMRLKALTPEAIGMAELAGEKVRATITAAPGNGAPIGGVKVISDNGWFAARPSGTEDIFKIYAESFRSEAHLREIQKAAHDALARVFQEPAPAGLAA